MLKFKNVTLEDKDWATRCMRQMNSRGSDYTFSNLFNWAEVHSFKIAQMDNMLLIRSGAESFNYMYPVGKGDAIAAIKAMEQDAREHGMRFVMYGIPKEGVDVVEAALPDKMEIKPVRDNFDYIYSRESLATLSGKKLHSKKNHANRFLKSHDDWKYEPINEQNVDEAWKMSVLWCKQVGCESHGLHRETCAVKSAMDHFFELGLKGALLRVDGRVVAYTVGSEVTDDTFVVHIEKAFPDVDGAYTMINQQFVKNELSKYEYVNREDDIGDEGLRKAKESYRPVMMHERFIAVEKK